jgi:hypothetical protein
MHAKYFYQAIATDTEEIVGAKRLSSGWLAVQQNCETLERPEADMKRLLIVCAGSV